MKRKSKLYLIAVSTLALLSSHSMDVSATTEVNDPPKISQQNSTQSFKVPVSKSTEQWSVTIGEAIYDHPNMSKPIQGVADMYSLLVKNKGNTVHHVTVDVYRNEPNSPTKFGLFSTQVRTSRNSETALLHKNFPVSVKANEIEVVVSWQDESTIAKDGRTKIDGRKYKQSFIFSR